MPVNIMARPLRLEFSGAVYHITSRGNARENIFLDHTDRKIFHSILSDTVTRFNWVRIIKKRDKMC